MDLFVNEEHDSELKETEFYYGLVTLLNRTKTNKTIKALIPSL